MGSSLGSLARSAWAPAPPCARACVHECVSACLCVRARSPCSLAPAPKPTCPHQPHLPSPRHHCAETLSKSPGFSGGIFSDNYGAPFPARSETSRKQSLSGAAGVTLPRGPAFVRVRAASVCAKRFPVSRAVGAGLPAPPFSELAICLGKEMTRTSRGGSQAPIPHPGEGGEPRRACQ